jgi:hypothetical protein
MVRESIVSNTQRQIRRTGIQDSVYINADLPGRMFIQNRIIIANISVSQSKTRATQGQQPITEGYTSTYMGPHKDKTK